jgi:putative ABC transport system permease protein
MSRGRGDPRREERELYAREVKEELRFHLEGRVSELMAQGRGEAEARRLAERQFGDVARIEAECREITLERVNRQRRSERMKTVLQDLRYGVRVLRRSPGFALIALLTLALGIGATTAIFSVVDAVLLRPLPYPDADRLVVVWETNPSQEMTEEPPSPPNFTDWRAAAESFEALTAWSEASPTLTGAERAEVLNGVGVGPDFFRAVGVAPQHGRAFLPEEEVVGGKPVVVVSHGLAQRLFGEPRTAVGGTVALSGQPVEIVGVMPVGFDLPRAEIDVWYPSDYARPTFNRATRFLNVFGRLRPGVTIEEATAEMNAIAARLETQYAETNTGWRVQLVDAQEQIVGRASAVLVLVFAAVGFVLLLACVNVANLLLGRSTARAGELAVRAALGASRGRLRGQLIAESVVLAVLAGTLGVGIAFVGLRVFLSLEPDAIPRAAEIGLDLRILGFAFLASAATGVFFGLVPAARALAGDLSATLREGALRAIGGRAGERARRVLIVSEVALALVLVVGAGLSLRSLARLRALDPGYETENVLAGRVSLGGTNYRDFTQRAQYFQRLRDELNALPEVVSAGITSTLPLDPAGTDFDLSYHAEGMPLVDPGVAPQVDYRIISPGLIETLGMRLLRGRDFNEFDRAESTPVMLVTRAFAERHWPGEDPIGKRIQLYYVQDRAYEVVGMVEDTRHQALAAPPREQMFVTVPQAEVLFGYMSFVVRTRGPAPGIEDRLRDVALALDPTEPIYDVQTLETLRGRATARERLAAIVFGAFALLAVVLSAAGIYGVISYQVARRTREIGVRMALGAARGGVVARVVGEAAGLAALGIGIGLIVALLATRSAEAFLFGISATDPATFAVTSVLLLGIAVVAALLPALRAAAIPPVEALRYE